MNYNNYLDNREKILKKSDWSLIDHWPLHAGKYYKVKSVSNSLQPSLIIEKL